MNKRYKNLLGYALNCITRYRVRTLVILVCLITCSSLFTSVAFLKDGLVKEGELSLKYAPDITVQFTSSGRQTFIQTAYVGYIQEMPGTVRVIPRIWGYANIGNILIVVVGIDLQDSIGDPALIYPIESGTFLSAQTQNSVV